MNFTFDALQKKIKKCYPINYEATKGSEKKSDIFVYSRKIFRNISVKFGKTFRNLLIMCNGSLYDYIILACMCNFLGNNINALLYGSANPIICIVRKNRKLTSSSELYTHKMNQCSIL